MNQARARFEAAQAEHQRQEAERRRALAVAKAKYDRKVTEERANAAASSVLTRGLCRSSEIPASASASTPTSIVEEVASRMGCRGATTCSA